MFRLTAQLGRRKPEIIDRTYDPAEAEYLRQEYQLAFGRSWTIGVKDIRAGRRRGGGKPLEEVAALRAQGMTAGEIANTLQMDRLEVEYRVRRLIAHGRSEKRPPGMKQSAESKALDDLIVDLRKSKVEVKAIATALDMDFYTVRSRIYKLHKQGRLP